MRVSQVNRALSLPRLNYGVSSKALGICWGPSALLFVLIGTGGNWYYALIPLGFALIVHAVLMWAYKKDHHAFDIYSRYSTLANEYHPNSRENIPAPFERPAKVGRGLRL